MRGLSGPRQGYLCYGLVRVLIFNVFGQVVPILRAGLVLLEQAATVLPNSQTFHVGYVRNEETLEVSLPGTLPASHCCLDMYATHLCFLDCLTTCTVRLFMQLCSNLVAWLRVSYCCKMPVNERRAHMQATAHSQIGSQQSTGCLW